VLKEALSDGTRRAGPRPEYAAELRRRLLSAAGATKTVREKSSRPILLGSILGTAIAVGLLVLVWSFTGEPAWAAAIRKAREQAWIHAHVDQDGVEKGQFWVSPDRDIVAARLGETEFIFDYTHNIFSRYDAGQNTVYRASQPEKAGLAQEMSSVADIAALFRRSSSAPQLLPNERIERRKLRSRVIDGIPSDEYEIVFQAAGRGLTTLSLAIDRRVFLPLVLTAKDSQGHATTLRFDYPPRGPIDEKSLGVPEKALIVEADPSGRVDGVSESLRAARENFDDYAALCVTTNSSSDSGELVNCEVRRLLRLDKKWRYDKVHVLDQELSLPSGPTQALNVWQAKRDRFSYERMCIFDGELLHIYELGGKRSPDGKALKTISLQDETQAGSYVPQILVPQGCCRPILATSALGRTFTPNETAEGLLKIEVSVPSNMPGKATPSGTYWLDPSRGNVVVREIVHHVRRSAATGTASPSNSQEIEFKDFRCSPNGFWYPTLIVREGDDKKPQQTTRFYVDFTNVPSDELFRVSN